MTKHYIRKDEFGTLYYYKDPEKTILHREDGPAVESTDRYRAWYQSGKLHRLDGPAREYADGIKQYWYQNEKFPSIKTNEQWKKHLKWMKFQ